MYGSRNCMRQCLCILLMLLTWVSWASEISRKAIPRSYGRLVLGMTIPEFRDITNGIPQRCVQCVPEETEITLYVDARQAKRFKQAAGVIIPKGRIQHQPEYLEPEEIVCGFYKGKLFFIALKGIREPIEALRIRYKKNLGRQLRETTRGSVREMYWEDAATRLSIFHEFTSSRKLHEIDVSDIHYTDMHLAKEIPAF